MKIKPAILYLFIEEFLKLTKAIKRNISPLKKILPFLQKTQEILKQEPLQEPVPEQIESPSQNKKIKRKKRRLNLTKTKKRYRFRNFQKEKRTKSASA